MKPNNLLDPLELGPPRRPRLGWPWLVLLLGLGAVLLWLLLARSNAPEEGGVREVRAQNLRERSARNPLFTVRAEELKAVVPAGGSALGGAARGAATRRTGGEGP